MEAQQVECQGARTEPWMSMTNYSLSCGKEVRVISLKKAIRGRNLGKCLGIEMIGPM